MKKLFRGIEALCVLAMIAGSVGGCSTPSGGKSGASSVAEPASRPQDILKKAQDAVAADSANAGNQYRLGNALFDMARYDEARAAYEGAIRLDPNHASAYCNLGLCLRKMGLLQEAISSYRKSLDIRPDDATVRFNLVTALEAAGDYEAAVKELRELSARQPEDVQAAAHLGNALFRLGRYKEAVPAFEKVLRLEPSRASHYYNLGLCFFCMENWDAALATWLTAFAHDSKDAPTNKGLAVVYWKRGDYKKAWESVARCQALGIALDPSFLADLQKDSGQQTP